MSEHQPKQWEFAQPAPEAFIERLVRKGQHPVVAQLLWARGYETADEALGFFDHYGGDDNPFRLKGMLDAVYRLRMAIRYGERIAVYGDFDCDGVTSTVLLTQALARLGADVQAYIPDRVDEGYGLNSPALKSLADDGVNVVVTVDCGIRSVKEVEDANSYGLDVIVSDHHSVGPNLPPAYAVINPKQADCPYPEKMLAGVGLAYKIVQGIYMEQQRRGYRTDDPWHPDDWLDLVAIGTVADIAPLRGENRTLVRRGLRRLQHPDRPGLRALYKVARIRPGEVTATTIGFQIGPRINAAGRLRSALLAVNLLNSEDEAAADELAQELNALNQERQAKTREMQSWAEEAFEDGVDGRFLLFATDDRFEQGVVGLVASRLTDTHYRPSVVVQLGEEESHASCRSIPEFHITHALEQCDDLLERYGGHAAAAGFTVLNDNIPALGERLATIAADSLSAMTLIPTLRVDVELPLADVNLELIKALDQLEPTGEANPTPVFVTRNVRVTDAKPVGAEGQHLKLRLADATGAAEAIAFRWGDRQTAFLGRIDVAYTVELDTWNGQQRIKLHLEDVRPAERSA